MLVIELESLEPRVEPECTKEELAKQVSDVVFDLCSELGMKKNCFYDIMTFLSEVDEEDEETESRSDNKRTFAKLSGNTLRTYKSKGLKYKYVFDEYRTLLRTIKYAVALYIGIDIEKITVELDGTVDKSNAKIEQYAGCLKLPEDHLREVEINWLRTITPFEIKLYKCYEAARMLEYPEEDMAKIADRLNSVSVALDFLQRISDESLIECETPMIIHRDERDALVHTLREIPEIIDAMQKKKKELHNLYIKYVCAWPEGQFEHDTEK